jgi:thiol-disulfide isomerase/thioredoxin
MLRPTLSFVRLPLKPLANTLTRTFSLLNPTQRSHVNRVFDPVRQPNDLHTLTLLNAADNRSLITFWSASWCQTCQTVKPLIRSLIEEEKVGEREGGLGFVEVQMDSTLIEDLPIKYRVRNNHYPAASTVLGENVVWGWGCGMWKWKLIEGCVDKQHAHPPRLQQTRSAIRHAPHPTGRNAK